MIRSLPQPPQLPHSPPLAQPPSMVAAQAPSLAAAQPPPLAAAQPPPLATAQPPPYPPARHLYQDYADEGPYFRAPAGQKASSMLPLWGRGPFCVPLPRSLRPSALTAPASLRNSSRLAKRASSGATSSSGWKPGLHPGAFKLLGGSPEAKVTLLGVR